ncbi:MAG: helix-turn-helix transcriptional regulator [Gammaproteobacteria bacterium]
MKTKIDVVRGSGNVFRDFGDVDAEVLQLKSILAVEIVKRLDHEKLTVREAHARTDIAAADFSRIRNADLARFTVDRLMTTLMRLGSEVDITFKAKRRNPARRPASGHAARPPEKSMRQTRA